SRSRSSPTCRTCSSHRSCRRSVRRSTATSASSCNHQLRSTSEPTVNNLTPFSPIGQVGTFALLAAYAVAAWCVAAGIAGNARKSSRLVNSSVYGLYGFAALVALASVMLIYAFVTHDFAIKYVADTSDTTMETWYKVTSFWGGLDGSLLLWVLVLALFSTVAIAVNHRRHRDMIGYGTSEQHTSELQSLT